MQLLALKPSGIVRVQRADLEAVQSVLSDELLRIGLDSDDSPNSAGLELEELIDLFSPYRSKPSSDDAN